MSQLFIETNQLISKICIICPERKTLMTLFEDIATELKLREEKQSKLDLRYGATNFENIHSWISFNLGQRSQLDVRLHLMGMDLEKIEQDPKCLQKVFELADAFYFDFSKSLSNAEQLVKMKIPRKIQEKPCLIKGILDSPGKQGQLVPIALKHTIEKNFQQLFILEKEQDFLKEGLEWVLSF